MTNGNLNENELLYKIMRLFESFDYYNHREKFIVTNKGWALEDFDFITFGLRNFNRISQLAIFYNGILILNYYYFFNC